jgi:hypothetical protein
MVKQHTIASWLIQRTQCRTKNTVRPLEVQALVCVVAGKGIRVEQVVGGAPRGSLRHVKDQNSVPPHIHDVHERPIALAIAHVDHEIRVQRTLQHLLGGERIGEHLLVGGEVEGDNFRWTELLQVGESVHDARVDDPETVALVDGHAVDGEEAIAVGVRGRGVSGPVGVWCEGWGVCEGWQLDG